MNISSDKKLRVVKKIKLLEIIGFVIIIIGFVLMILNNQINNSHFSQISERYNLFFSVGFLIWAIGYFLKINKKTK